MLTKATGDQGSMVTAQFDSPAVWWSWQWTWNRVWVTIWVKRLRWWTTSSLGESGSPVPPDTYVVSWERNEIPPPQRLLSSHLSHCYKVTWKLFVAVQRQHLPVPWSWMQWGAQGDFGLHPPSSPSLVWRFLVTFKDEVSYTPLWSQLQFPAQNSTVASFYIRFPLVPNNLILLHWTMWFNNHWESVPSYRLLTFHPTTHVLLYQTPQRIYFQSRQQSVQTMMNKFISPLAKQMNHDNSVMLTSWPKTWYTLMLHRPAWL